MFPFVRNVYGIWKATRQAPLGWFDTHVSHHRIWPWDIDPWMELNNGRTLTLYDLGRLPLFTRMGLVKGSVKAGMFFTVAGSSVRYRTRVRPMTVVELRSRMLGFDDRFIYVDHQMWQGDACANHGLIRSAIARRGKGIVPPTEVAEIMGLEAESPPLPDWVNNWIAAEATRPWPPDRI